MDYVRRFEDVQAGDAGTFGKNAATLGEMKRGGLPAPPGFCLSAEAYREFLADGKVDKTIAHILAGLQLNDPEDVEVRTEQVRNFMSGRQMPARIANEVLRGYYELSVDLGWSDEPVSVALRPSMTSMEVFGCTGSGWPDAHLNVSGEAHLLEHIQRCWGELWSARAVAYRVRESIDHAEPAVAVIVQAMIQAEVSGYMFGSSALTTNCAEVVILACWGLSEAIISGLVTPDAFVVRRGDGAIVARYLTAKNRMVECTKAGGTIERELTPERRRLPALSETQIAELLGLSRELEEIDSATSDIEWAYARGRFHVLQALDNWSDLPYARSHHPVPGRLYDCLPAIEMGL
jgi:phosphoenolpyruvate synthase/pyruvate phosphate dikinase